VEGSEDANGSAWMISKVISQHFFHKLGCTKPSKGKTTAFVYCRIRRKKTLGAYRCELLNYKNQTKLQARLESSFIMPTGKERVKVEFTKTKTVLKEKW